MDAMRQAGINLDRGGSERSVLCAPQRRLSINSAEVTSLYKVTACEYKANEGFLAASPGSRPCLTSRLPPLEGEGDKEDKTNISEGRLFRIIDQGSSG